MWLSNNSWHDRFAHLSKTAENYERMRHLFEDSCNMNVWTENCTEKIIL